MRTLIANKELGIDENDIQSETNLDVLNAWSTDLDRQHQTAKRSIENEKAKLDEGQRVDKMWENRVKGFMSTLFILKKLIIDKKRIIKKELAVARNNDHNRLLIDALRKEVGEDKFLFISQNVNSMLFL